MPTVPASYTPLVRKVGTADLASLSAELATQLAAGYWLTDIRFFADGSAVMLFGKNDLDFTLDSLGQKLNEVANTQVDIDADVNAEGLLGYIPTGLFVNFEGDTLFVHYAQIGNGIDE